MLQFNLFLRSNNEYDEDQLIMKCACCGEDMKLDKETGRTVSYKCTYCGLSNTELKKDD